MPEQSSELSIAEQIDSVCDRYEAAWKSGERPRIEDYLSAAAGDSRGSLLRNLLEIEIELLVADGNDPPVEEYRRRFPADVKTVEAAFETALAGSRKDTRSDRDLAITISLHTPGVDTSHPGGEPPPVPMPEKIGRFEVKSFLGQGAFGAVFRARDPQLDRDVAVKVPRDGVLATAEDKQRFLREARAAGTLNHAHVCPVFEVGEEEDARPFIVMALVEGRSLADLLGAGKEISQKQAAAVVRKIALAMEDAHRQGIIHRDLKPGNLMINRRGEPVIMDFGLAHVGAEVDVQLTQSGILVGTPAYMSPEQARGRGKEVTAASDIYSLGVILYELLAGCRPYEGSFAEVMGMILHVEPPPPSAKKPGIDPALEAICRKAMAKRPEERFGSMEELAAAIEEYFQPKALPVEPKSTSFRWIALATASAALILAGVLFFARTPTAKVIIDVDVDLSDKSQTYFLDDQEIAAEKLAGFVELPVGKHVFVVKRDDAIAARYVFKVIKDPPSIKIVDDPRNIKRPTEPEVPVPPKQVVEQPPPRWPAGEWIPLIRSAEEVIEGKTAFPSDDGGKVTFGDGVLTLTGNSEFAPEVIARDYILCAKVKKIGGQNLFLRARQNNTRNFGGYGFWFNGSQWLGATVGVGKYPQRDWKSLKTQYMQLLKDNECELALAVRGNRVTAYLNGRVAIELTDDDCAEGLPVLAVRQDAISEGHSEFRDLELFILDGTQLTPDDIMRKHSPPLGPNDDWARPITLELLDKKNIVTVKVGAEKPHEVEAKDQLPEQPFKLMGATFRQKRGADEFMNRLSGFPHVMVLNFVDSDLTDAGAAHVAKFKGLRALDVSGSQVTAQGMLKFKALRTLKRLTAREEQLTEEVRQMFARELPDCGLVVAAAAHEP